MIEITDEQKEYFEQLSKDMETTVDDIETAALKLSESLTGFVQSTRLFFTALEKAIRIFNER